MGVTEEAMRREGQVETDLENFIERRHDQRVREDGRDRAEEEMWAESARKHAANQREQARLEWRSHHTGQAQRLRRTLEDLIRHHESEAAKLGGDAA